MENIPNIRFKAYHADWEQRKLSECAGFRRGSFPQPYGNKEWYDGEGAMPFVQVADVSSDMKLVNDTKQKISKLAQPMSVYADKGSVLVTLQGSIGRVAITQYGAFVDRTVLIFDKYNQNIDKAFWAYIIKEKFIEEARKAPGGTIKTITKEALSDFDLMLPNYDEQKKLGAFLVSIDNLITLHQRKCDETKELKKYMLHKMFPRNGEKAPEIRFNGFTDPWEQRKLSELTDYSNGTGHEEYVVAQGKYELITLKSINSEGELVSSEKYVDEEFETLKQGTLIMMLSEQAKGMLGMTTVIPCNNRYVLNQRVAALTLHDKVSSSFLTKAINNKQPYFEQMGAGTKVQNISRGHVENCLIEIPRYDEQKQIGDYFENIDNLITIHQRKCDKLKGVKQYMLQNMFPKRG